jgi:hypothetical protein
VRPAQPSPAPRRPAAADPPRHDVARRQRLQVRHQQVERARLVDGQQQRRLAAQERHEAVLLGGPGVGFGGGEQRFKARCSLSPPPSHPPPSLPPHLYEIEHRGQLQLQQDRKRQVGAALGAVQVGQRLGG